MYQIQKFSYEFFEGIMRLTFKYNTVWFNIEYLIIKNELLKIVKLQLYRVKYFFLIKNAL